MAPPNRRAAPVARRESRRWEKAPPDPGIIPGGIRDRAMRAVLRHGPRAERAEQAEDENKTRASVKFEDGVSKKTEADVVEAEEAKVKSS
jgi:hypothetical protein